MTATICVPLRRFIGLALLGSGLFTASAHAANIKLITTIGAIAPGTSQGFVSFGTPSINNRGEVIFFGSTDSTTSTGVWKYDPVAGLTPVAIRGQAAPGMPVGTTFFDWDFAGNGGNNRGSVIALNNSGRTAFWANTSVGLEGFWVADPATGLQFVAKEGDLAPGTTATFNRLANQVPAVSDRGDVAIKSTLNVTGHNGVVHRYSDAAGLEFIVKDLSPVAGMVSQSYQQAGFEGAVIDNSGGVHFKSSLAPPFDSNFSGQGIGVGRPSQPTQLLLQNGQQAAGLPAGALWSNIYSFETAANSAGQITFASGLAGTGIDSTNNLGLWAGQPDALSLVARRGDPVPGMASGVVFEGFYHPEINAQGHIAFRGFISGPGVFSSIDEAVFVQQPDGTLRLVAREGETPPGAPAGVFFGDRGFGAFNDIVMIARGQVAFRGFVVGAGVPSGQTEPGIWAT